MKIRVLMEDTEGSCGAKAEHGLCFYVETEKHVILADTGASDLTWENAESLNADLSRVDTAVISHGHYDHAGGLISFAQKNPGAAIYMQKSALGDFYHDERYIGIDKKIAGLDRLKLVDGDFTIDGELSLFSGIKGRRCWPSGNRVMSEILDGQRIPDSFQHEQCLVISEAGKKTLISGCAHNGILNILDRFREIYGCNPDTVLSGFHMMKKSEYTPEEADDIRKTALELAEMNTVFYTGHCTGEKALVIMEQFMPNLRRLHAGDVICC